MGQPKRLAFFQLQPSDDHLAAGSEIPYFLGNDGFFGNRGRNQLAVQDGEFFAAMPPTAEFSLTFAGRHDNSPESGRLRRLDTIFLDAIPNGRGYSKIETVFLTKNSQAVNESNCGTNLELVIDHYWSISTFTGQLS
jgi:hypothetical protein